MPTVFRYHFRRLRGSQSIAESSMIMRNASTWAYFCTVAFHELDRTLSAVVTDLLERWQKADGSFRARKLMIGWDNVPMHRWAQSQIFRSLCFLSVPKPERVTRISQRRFPSTS